jgi:hypothetical protein
MSTQNTATSDTVGQQILDFYHKGNFKELAKSNLEVPVDSEGNTIVHVMAKNNDKNAFDKLLEQNPKLFDFGLINKPNLKSELPIHQAVESSANQKDQSFITYMIEKLKANPNIPDNNNRIVIKKEVSVEKEPVSPTAQNIERLNQRVLDNMKKLADKAEKFVSDQWSALGLNQSTTTVNLPELDNIKKSINSVRQRTDGNLLELDNLEKYIDLAKQKASAEGIDIEKLKQLIENAKQKIGSSKELEDIKMNLNSLKEKIQQNMKNMPEVKNIKSDLSSLKEKVTSETGGDRQVVIIMPDLDGIKKLIDDIKKRAGTTSELVDIEKFIDSAKQRINTEGLDIDRIQQTIEEAKKKYGANAPELDDIKHRLNLLKQKMPQMISSNSDYLDKLQKYINQKRTELSPKINRVSGDWKNVAELATTNEPFFDTPKKCDIKRTSEPVKTQNQSANVKFIEELTNLYTSSTKTANQQNTQQAQASQSGGYSGKRVIKNRYSGLSEFSEHGMNDSFMSKKKRQMLNDLSNIISSQDRPKPDQVVTDAYNAILKKIMELLGVDEETGRIYRSALKITVTRKNPELRKRENDALKVKEIEKIVEDKKSLQKALKEIDIDEIKAYMAEQKSLAEERRAEWEKTKGNKKGDKQNKKEEISESTEPTESKPKKERKTTKKASKVAENGYLQSDEIIFSEN